MVKPSPEEQERLREEKSEEKLRQFANLRGVSASELKARLLSSGLQSEQEARERDEIKVTNVVFTATTDEHEAILSVAESYGLKPTRKTFPSKNGYTYNLFRQKSLSLAEVFLKGMGPGIMGQAGPFVVVATGATRVFLVGFCFGTSRAYQSIGDVIVAESVRLYDERNVTSALGECPAWLYTFRGGEIACSLDLATEIWQASQTLDGVKVHPPGLLISGGARIESSAYLRFLTSRCGNALGGDMEACAFAQFAQGMSTIRWTVIKGIGDFAEDTREDLPATRKLATLNAAKVFWNHIFNPSRPSTPDQEVRDVLFSTSE